MSDKILTDHPEPGKTGRRIDKDVYDRCRSAILGILRESGGEVTHTELFNELDKRLAGKVTGNIGWYGETVKLDLEAKKIIRRLPGSPQRIQLVNK